jgi:hypothetical protein
MGKPKAAIQGIRVNLHLYPEVAAQLKLACVDTAFGGVRYGEQTRIVNAALAAYFEGAPSCTVQKQSLESSSSEPLLDSES